MDNVATHHVKAQSLVDKKTTMDWTPILDVLCQTAEPLRIVDVGARWGIDTKWMPLAECCQIIGFDPDAAECERLNRSAPAHVRYYPIALGDRERDAVLHITVEPACSSLYPPIVSLSQTAPGLVCIAPAATQTVSLVPFDNWQRAAGIGPLTYMKLDTQGSELDILRGASTALNDVELVEIEVEFNPIYEGQPLFGDVDRFMRTQGFVLWHLANKVHYLDRSLAGVPISIPEVAYFDSAALAHLRGSGQLYWAHAFYVKNKLSLESSATLPLNKAIKLVAVALACNLPDLAFTALHRVPIDTLTERAVSNIREAILTGFALT